VVTKSIKSIFTLIITLGKLFFFNNLTNKRIHFWTNSVLKNKIWISIENIRKHYYKHKKRNQSNEHLFKIMRKLIRICFNGKHFNKLCEYWIMPLIIHKVLKMKIIKWVGILTLNLELIYITNASKKRVIYDMIISSALLFSYNSSSSTYSWDIITSGPNRTTTWTTNSNHWPSGVTVVCHNFAISPNVIFPTSRIPYLRKDEFHSFRD
jgi:hypothetical protein